jgi:cation diffusion facilitator CzcD-associated flavoprotein CzcO
VPAEVFIRYGRWFAKRLVPEVEPEQVQRIERADGEFRLTLGSGVRIAARQVVIAAGLGAMATIPPELAAAVPSGPSPAAAVSHSSQHHDLSGYAGARVAVVGAGQSALESAALLHEAGAEVTVLARGQVRFGLPPKPPARGAGRLLPRANSPLGPTWRIYPFSHAPGQFRYLPAQTRVHLARTVLGPLGAWWLRDRVIGHLPILEHRQLVDVRADDGDPGEVRLMLASGGERSELTVDHVVAATGYRVDLGRLSFIAPEITRAVRRLAGWPALTSHFESSVPGLYFVGAEAASTFGPLMRFVCGSGFAARRVSAAVAGHAAASAPARNLWHPAPSSQPSS